jgi:hypothetical protein
MADYSQTAASFQHSADATKKPVTFGGTIVAGQPVYRDAADGKYKLARANAGTTDDVAGFAACGGADGQAGVIITKDPDCIMGMTMTKGDIICLSPGAAGGLCEEGDAAITTGAFKVVLGIATSTTNAAINCVEKLEVGSAL